MPMTLRKLKKYNNPFTINGTVYSWQRQISECITLGNREYIPLKELIKEILLKNGLKLTYNNIEQMKYELIKLYCSDKQQFSLARTSSIFCDKEDKKYLPVYESSFVSHLSIRDFKAFMENEYVTE